MDVRFGLLFLFVVGTSWSCNARELGSSDLFAKETEISDASGSLQTDFILYVQL